MFSKIPKIRVPKWLPMRYLLSVECFLGLTISYMMRFCLSLTMIRMARAPHGVVDNTSCPNLVNEDSQTNFAVDFAWNELQQGIILSSLFYGYMVFMIPSGVLADKFGAGPVMFIGVFLTSVFSLLTPISAFTHWIVLCVVRASLGVSQAMLYAPLHCMVSSWIPPKERGTWASVIFSGAHMGSALNNSITGVLLGPGQLHWKWVFYIYGGAGMLWSIIFLFSAYSSPSDCSHLSEKEKKMFDEAGMSEHKVARKIPIPAIITNLPIWAIIIGMIGHDWGIFTLVSDIPKFIHAVLHLKISSNGVLNSFIFVMIWIMGVLTGILTDFIQKKNVVSTTFLRKAGTTIASVGPSVGLVFSVYTNCDRVLAIVSLYVGCALMGFFYSSLKVSPIDVAPNFSGTIGAISQTAGAMSGALVPTLIGKLTPDGTLHQWRVVMWVTFAVMSLTNAFYVIFASAEPQPFNSPKDAEIWEERKEAKKAKKRAKKGGDVSGSSQAQL